MSETNGNVAAMREALESVAAWLLERFGNPADPDHDKAEGFYILTTGVLAAPPRNCDVGTPEEQLERWESFCNRNWNRNYASRGLDPCDDCELVEFGNCRCQLAWAQLPYEAAKEGGAL